MKTFLIRFWNWVKMQNVYIEMKYKIEDICRWAFVTTVYILAYLMIFFRIVPIIMWREKRKQKRKV